jgi:hypothetical protein
MTVDGPLPAHTAGPPRRRRWLVWLAVAAGTALGLVVLAALLAGPALVWLGAAWRAPEPTLERDVRALFERAEPGEGVVLAEATPFAWDRVGVFGPYTPPETVRDAMGVRVPRGATNALGATEGFCLLVFAAGNRRAGWTLVERDVADCIESSGQVLPRERARFRGDALVPTAA